MTYWQLISTGDPVQTGDPVGSDRITTSPARAGTGETGKGPVTGPRIYPSRMSSVGRGTGTPKDRDEVNRRDVSKCDG